MTILFDPLLFDGDIFDIGFIAVDPPRDWNPPLDLAKSSIIGQALRFMRLAPVPRHDPGSELLPALVDAHASASDDLLASADLVRADLSWLREVELVRFADDVASLTERGRDVAAGRAVFPG